jgi:transposase
MNELGLFTLALGFSKPWQVVVNFLDARVTNGMVEGLNSKIKTAMRRAYGFKQVGYLRTIIYLVTGRLTFSSTQ